MVLYTAITDMNEKIYGALVQFGCYQRRYEWKGLVLYYSSAAINTEICECVEVSYYNYCNSYQYGLFYEPQILFVFTVFYLLLATCVNRMRNTTIRFKLKRISRMFSK